MRIPLRQRSVRPALAVAAAVLLLAGCSDSDSSDDDQDADGAPTSSETADEEQDLSVDEDEVEDQIATQLEAEVGQTPDEVDCPDDLEGTVGATMECVLTAGPDQLGVTVTVTAVEGTDVKFDIQVDDEVM